MNISNVCILCRKNVADTKEHFIPQIIGEEVRKNLKSIGFKLDDI